MNKKIIFCSVAMVFVLIFTGFSSAVTIQDKEVISFKKNLVPIQVNYFDIGKPDYFQTMVSDQKAEEIKQILILLHEAIEKNDDIAIQYYTDKLYEKNIFGDRFHRFNINEVDSSKPKQIPFHQYSSIVNNNNISNENCYVNAIGEGAALWGFAYRFYENMLRIIRNASSVIQAFVLLIIFLPFLALAFLFSSLIPVRLFTPNGTISLKNGTITTRGDLGHKNIDVGEESFNVDVSWFTGISINIPGSDNKNSFLFVSGFARTVDERI